MVVLLRVAGVLGALVLVLALEGLIRPAYASEPAATQYYPDTGQLVPGPFASFVERHGADFLGPPLTQAYMEDGRLVQWFSNGRLEVENGHPALSQLGGYLFEGETAAPTPPPTTLGPHLDYFSETGFLVGYAILDFYRTHGGAEVLGPPIAPQAGNAQWFERARLEWDPVDRVVRMAELGREALAQDELTVETPATTWIGNHRPAAFHLPDGQVETLPSWRALLLLDHEDGLLRVWDPLPDRFGWVEPDVVGPIEPPLWHGQLAGASRLSVPGRAVRVGVNVPEPGNLAHNAPLTVRLSYTAADGQVRHLTETGQDLPAEAVRVPGPPTHHFEGKWIDADLRTPTLVTAYEGDRPVYAALAVRGRAASETPTGVFHILRRVANETMDSSTIGIPRDGPGGYYLEDVLFTQYFTWGGAAIHYNYWLSTWGYPGSQGCLGMNYEDSLWFWEWAEVGTPIVIRN